MSTWARIQASKDAQRQARAAAKAEKAEAAAKAEADAQRQLRQVVKEACGRAIVLAREEAEVRKGHWDCRRGKTKIRNPWLEPSPPSPSKTQNFRCLVKKLGFWSKI